MAFDRQLGPSWREEQRDNRYPFSDDSTLLSTSGLRLAPELVLDAQLYPGLGEVDQGAERAEAGPLFLSRLTSRQGRITLTVGDSALADRASVSFDPLESSPLLELQDGSGRQAGVLVLDPDRLLELATWPEGTHPLGALAATFVLSCQATTPVSGLWGVQLPGSQSGSGPSPGEVIPGDLLLVAENGVVFRMIQAGDNPLIRLDVVGDPLSRRKICEPAELFTTPRFVRTINNVAPDPSGRFTLAVAGLSSADDVLRLYQEGNDLIVELVGQRLAG